MKRIEILIDEANPDKKIGISYNKDSFEIPYSELSFGESFPSEDN